jgi:hypothetical protein
MKYAVMLLPIFAVFAYMGFDGVCLRSSTMSLILESLLGIIIHNIAVLDGAESISGFLGSLQNLLEPAKLG